jgi:hypothetical protein
VPNGKRRAPLASPLPTRQGVPPLPVLDSFRRGPGAASEYGSHIPPVGSVFSPARGRDSQRLGFPSPLSDSPISHAQDSQDRGPWEKSRSAEGCEVQAWEDGLEIVPVYKGATMWTQLTPLMSRRGSQMLAASLWRQVAEWFETSAQVCQSTYKLGGSCCEFLACN